MPRTTWLSGTLCRIIPVLWVVSFALLATGTRAAPEPAEPATSASAAPPAPEFAWEKGPAQIELGHDLTLALPADRAYLPDEKARKLLEKMGNFHNDNVLGIVSSTAEHSEWFVVIRFEPEGYIKDDEEIDADELLESIRDGMKTSNEEREKHGFLALNVEGWSEKPHYDKALHHLTWALTVSDKEGKSVNHNTRILGRHGFVSLNLVTSPEALAQDRAEAIGLLQATTFKSGARYQDFDSKTDKVAEYGLTGLVLAGAGLGAAKLVKLGLLAKFWKFIVIGLLAAKKALVALLIAAGAFLKRLFSRQKEATPEPPGS